MRTLFGLFAEEKRDFWFDKFGRSWVFGGCLDLLQVLEQRRFFILGLSVLLVVHINVVFVVIIFEDVDVGAILSIFGIGSGLFRVSFGIEVSESVL